ncbi:MAG TPA: hypothetical protein VMP68_08870 [Candidatus Eisenbacteria bacterium]|nr:hypothetical protein [Candidatus Eisenbacteria bacterium]
MDHDTTESLIYDIANRKGTVKELAIAYGISPKSVREFAEVWHSRIVEAAHKAEIETLQAELEELRAAPSHAPAQQSGTVTPEQLADLWISNKFERLKRLQDIAEATEDMVKSGAMSPAELSMAVREFRSYLMLAANELGQLLHRGSGESSDGDTLSVSIEGVDMDALR